MKYTIETEGTIQTIEISYQDEGVDLQQSRRFSGTIEAAEAYVPVMDSDIREAFAHMFPEPEVEEHDHHEEDME